ncbi:MarR family winged helix-turn-helix transcriptional regulator [Alkalilimnicola sp. S0819]|uniref:MarR family winged helix-turn-helix transcriptional regulator n=1 Tax=Alkalilimnicola sp. S0819 TaxID=2613922 RepID=UPI00186A6650|nr:MarR family transcriptional regulator [Alkalilimnicola sp. S0819]
MSDKQPGIAATDGVSALPFRPSDWPMPYLAGIEREHTLTATLVLRRFDIDHKSWRLLAVLKEHGELTVSALAELAVLERSSVSKMVATLEARGLVLRHQQGRDRRQSNVALTEGGDALYQETAPLISRLFEYYFGGFDDEEFQRFMSALRDVMERVRSARLHPWTPRTE